MTKAGMFVVGFLAGCILTGLLMSGPDDNPCTIESRRPIRPHVQAISEDGWNWDTIYTYHSP